MNKDKAKMKHYNCGKLGHFAHEYTKPKKINPNLNSCFLYVYTHVSIDHSLLGWIVDSRVAKDLVKDQVGFVDYRRIPTIGQNITPRNRTREDVLGVGTY